ncbi:MAG: hypothetical protein AMXMBFR84_46800 [Candidatus Hydrogenedentota bacterium]
MIFNIAIFLLVIGLLVFFHEMGHFLAAKACGIYCPRFSLGMPPRLFGFKIGETDYCVGLLPIGGYVKMAGQEDSPLTEEEREKDFGHVPPERWYSNKPVWQRMIVIVAGPAMNVVLAILIYAVVNGFGAYVPDFKTETRIGAISPQSPSLTAPMYHVSEWTDTVDFTGTAEEHGWKTGDRIVAIDGSEVKTFNDVSAASVLSGGSELTVHIEREAADGTTLRYVSRVTPEKIEGVDVPVIGIEAFHSAYLENVLPDSPAERAGLKKGDVVDRLNGQPIDSQTFVQAMEKVAPDSTIDLVVTRDGQQLEMQVTPERKGRVINVHFSPPPGWLSLLPVEERPEVRYENVEFLSKAGFQLGDVVVEIDGATANYGMLRAIAESPEKETVNLSVERKGGIFGFGAKGTTALTGVAVSDVLQAVTPFDIFAAPTVAQIAPEVEKATGLQRMDELLTINGEPASLLALEKSLQENRGKSLNLTVKKPALGAGMIRSEETAEISLPVADVAAVEVAFGTKMVFHRLPAAQVLPASLSQTWQDLDRTVLILRKLFAGGVSPQTLGGPLMIYQVTTASAASGYVWLMDIMALISVNLAIFNLLPLPVLDGGHLFFLTVEAIRRKPVNRRFMEWVQQAGVLLIIFLILFVTYNDLKRLVVNTIMP